MCVQISIDFCMQNYNKKMKRQSKVTLFSKIIRTFAAKI